MSNDISISGSCSSQGGLMLQIVNAKYVLVNPVLHVGLPHATTTYGGSHPPPPPPRAPPAVVVSGSKTAVDECKSDTDASEDESSSAPAPSSSGARRRRNRRGTSAGMTTSKMRHIKKRRMNRMKAPALASTTNTKTPAEEFIRDMVIDSVTRATTDPPACETPQIFNLNIGIHCTPNTFVNINASTGVTIDLDDEDSE